MSLAYIQSECWKLPHSLHCTLQREGHIRARAHTPQLIRTENTRRKKYCSLNWTESAEDKNGPTHTHSLAIFFAIKNNLYIVFSLAHNWRIFRFSSAPPQIRISLFAHMHTCIVVDPVCCEFSIYRSGSRRGRNGTWKMSIQTDITYPICAHTTYYEPILYIHTLSVCAENVVVHGIGRQRPM